MNGGSEPDYDVFVSHSSVDAEVAHDLVAHLEASGLRCWIAPRDIHLGQEYGTEIIRGLQRANGIVVLLSGRSRESRHVRAEVERATHLNHAIYWIRLEPIEPGEQLEFFLSQRQSIDAFEGEHAEHWDRLAKAIKGAPVLTPQPQRPAKAQSPPPRRAGQRWTLRFARVLLYTLLGWGLLEIDPLGLGSAMNHASERVVYNLLAPFYGKDVLGAQDVAPGARHVAWNRNITVLLFDDSALSAQNLTWPVSPEFHAQRIADLYRTYQPAAIMIDLLFLDRRDNEAGGLKALRQVLQTIKEEGKTKVFLASNNADARKSDILEELRDVAELVAVSWTVGVDFRKAQLFYPMATGAGTAQMATGEVADTDPGPAYAIYRDLCDRFKGDARTDMHCPAEDRFGVHFQEPMQVFWGVNAPPLNWEQSNLGERFNCRAVAQTLFGRTWDFIVHGVTGASDSFPQSCPYSQLVMVRDFADSDFRKLKDVSAAYRQALEQAPASLPKIVFYSADLRGMQDSLVTYTHGTIAGVYLHAMALDNLLTLGDSYIRFAADRWIRHAMELLLALAVAVVSVFLTDLRHAARQATNEDGLAWQVLGATSRSAVGGFVLTAFNFLLILPLLAAAVYVAFVMYRYAPVNWVGFLGVAGMIRIIEWRGVERTTTAMLTRLNRSGT